MMDRRSVFAGLAACLVAPTALASGQRTVYCGKFVHTVEHDGMMLKVEFENWALIDDRAPPERLVVRLFGYVKRLGEA